MRGVLIIDKPFGISSMTALEMIKRRLPPSGDADASGAKQKRPKVGHAGTLDPRATGVLTVAIGDATRAIDRLMSADKRYLTTIDLSGGTTTDDLEGERLTPDAGDERAPSRAQVERTLDQFTGEIMQRPPAFSAVKVDGRRAYKVARGGAAPAIEPRPVIVHSLRLVQYAWPALELEIRCGKGFYVRSLARDLGQTLGRGGHCTAIRRTAVGPFTIDMARPLDALSETLTQSDLLSLEQALAMLARATE